jgi:hypothetical protein
VRVRLTLDSLATSEQIGNVLGIVPQVFKHCHVSRETIRLETVVGATHTEHRD